MTQQQKKELLRSQQGELDAVLMYQRLAKIVKTEEERAAFVQLAKEEGRHKGGSQARKGKIVSHSRSLLRFGAQPPV